jgi:serine/threonine-protein kinase
MRDDHPPLRVKEMMPELSPDEWAALKSHWPDVERLDRAERRSHLESLPLTPAARSMLASLLDVDESTGPQLDRAAFELLEFRPMPPADVAPSMVGRRLGAYIVRRLVGRGGMGAVYEAERADDTYTQRVAIKTLWRGADSDVLLQRFRSERQILAALQHPNIAPLLDGGTTEEGTPWLAMEFVEGTPLDAWCDEQQLDLPARLDLFRQVCAAVQHAHQRLVVHRDLKPSNILVNRDGTVKLLDFGVAKLLESADTDGTLTGAGLSPFTAAFAAPEQMEAAPASTATDVYALGGILTVLLAGEPPRAVQGKGTRELLGALRDGVARAPSAIAVTATAAQVAARGFSSASRLSNALRGELDAIAGMALRPEPARRYASVEALSDDVRRYLRRDRVIARPDGTAYRLWTFVRRRRALSAVAAVTTVLLIMSSVVTWRQSRAARAEARRAERATAFLSGLVTGSNATSYDPLVRLAPNGTVAQLLDSALVRIPREFADDERIRARLYTAIGANLVNQGRIGAALAVLDSAQRLAADGYGRTSVEYARANLEYAALRLAFDGPLATDSALRDADIVANAHPEDRELPARIDLLRAARAMQLGHIGEADSLAADVLANERRRARSMLSLRAEAMRMYASSWIRRDPRDYLRRARAVQRLADSLGLDGTNETEAARSAEFESLLVLGRAAEAEAVLRHIRERATAGNDTSALARARYGYQRAYLAAVSGDTAARRLAAAELRASLRSQPLIGADEWLTYAGVIVDEALSRRDTAVALTEARLVHARSQRTSSPMILGFAAWYLGQAELAAQHPAEALTAITQGQRVIAQAPELESVQPLLRRVQLGALVALGRTAEADSVRASIPKRGAIPPCTPGGAWKGCPDLPP